MLRKYKKNKKDTKYQIPVSPHTSEYWEKKLLDIWEIATCENLLGIHTLRIITNSTVIGLFLQIMMH